MGVFLRKMAQLSVGGILLAGVCSAALAQQAPAPTPAQQAVAARKAVFTLIANNFRPLGDVVKGNVPYDAADVQKRLTRLTFLAGYVDDVFPDISNVGEPDSKSKPEVWTDHAGFVAKSKDFQTHLAALVEVNAKEKSNSDAFKAAFATVGGDCKGCHETYKVK